MICTENNKKCNTECKAHVKEQFRQYVYYGTIHYRMDPEYCTMGFGKK